MTEPLFVQERRRTILDQLKQTGRVSVKALSDQLKVSAVTIRQDLRALEDDGQLERTYGGAVLRTTSAPAVLELAFDVRREKNQAEKDAIGQAAAALVKDGYGIFLDASTTAYAMTPYLKRLDALTIVTNSLMIAQQFLDSPRIHVILPGGHLRRDSISVVGNPHSLPAINLTIGFFGARGLTLETGATDVGPEEVEIKKTVVAHCITPVVIIDSTKWGQVAPFTYLAAPDIARVITTEKAPLELVEPFENAGVVVDMVSLE